MLTLRAKDGIIFTFDVVTHTWGATDVLPDIELAGTIATGSLTITLPGRFQLVFDAAHKWQASRWYDLASDPTLNLARTDGATLNYNVIQSPLELNYDQWYNLDNATNPTIIIQEQDATHVTLQTGWEWHTDDYSTFVVSTTHTIRSNGAWQVQTFLTNKTNVARTLTAFEVAFTNIRTDIEWQEAISPLEGSFSLTRSTGTTPRPVFTVMRNSGSGKIDTDDTGNHYWTISAERLEPNQTWKKAWTNYLWPGHP